MPNTWYTSQRRGVALILKGGGKNSPGRRCNASVLAFIFLLLCQFGQRTSKAAKTDGKNAKTPSTTQKTTHLPDRIHKRHCVLFLSKGGTK